ncbi:MAG: hypothetical protein HWN65_19055 [Candidatus Helarchaeota archaeon]|nr:hypothetical protein [Candidatus Helarchaeota archaeon]
MSLYRLSYIDFCEKVEKGCHLRVSLKPKEPEMLEVTDSDSVAQVRNGPPH